MTTSERIRQNMAGTVAGVAMFGPKPQLHLKLQWPPEFHAAFVITIRPERYAGFRARMGPWAARVQRIPGTNGAMLNVNQWKNKGIVAHDTSLRRGEIGCYDSHVRIWRTIVQKKIPQAIIFEDDVNMRYIESHANRLRSALDEVKKLQLPYHFMYVGGWGKKSSNYSPTIARPHGCNTLPAYILTYEGAKLLLAHASPYRIPVDVVISNLHDKNVLKAVAMDPPLCHMVKVVSDTNNIK
jgi:glycosyl transferase family 25